MAHQLTRRNNGQYEMAYVGAKPWHGLGQELKHGAAIEEWLKAAGMDWTVMRGRVRYATERDGKALREYPDRLVFFRSDNKDPLAINSDMFKTVQPKQVLEFFRDLAAAGGFHLTTAGTLYGGKKFWAMATAGEEAAIVGKDMIKANLLFATAVDGSMENVVKRVSEAVVCANTLAIAMGERGGAMVKVSHKTKFNEAAVKAEMGLASNSFAKFITTARTLAKRKVDKAEAELFAAVLTQDMEAPAKFIVDKHPKDEIDALLRSARDDKAFQKVMSLFNGGGRGSSMPGRAGTAWGLVNAVTEYVDHYLPSRTPDKRIDKAWFGGGDALKTTALETAVALV